MTLSHLIRRELHRAESDGVTVVQDPGVSGDGTYLGGYLAALRWMQIAEREHRGSAG
jgi:hypothetical protein